jgi:membrane protein YqaA with SNARE-associated domain
VTAGLLTLFVAAFGAATILPLQSEIVFAALQLRGGHAPWLLVLVASLGNTLGSLLTYAMGRGVERFRDRRWFPVSPERLDRAQAWFRRWGLWSLLLSWAPLGDAIVLASGVLRAPWPPVLLLLAVAKTGRYVVLALLTAGLAG